MLSDKLNLKIWLRSNVFCQKCADAQLIMMPEGRNEIKPLDDSIPAREGAVAIIFFQKSSTYHVFYIRRPDYDGVHGGQVSFPGGKSEPCDKSLLETAQRECFEEIGVVLSKSDYVGRLAELFIPISNINVTPFLFVLDCEPDLNIDEHEVAYVFSVSLEEIVNDDNVQSKQRVFDGKKFEIPFFKWNNECIWGATAMMSSQIKCLLQKYLMENKESLA